MPIFFNKEQLTELQRTNWDAAVARYKEVMAHNDKLSHHLSVLMHSLEPGHAKSALFARLLEGKEPLPYPPATSFSYPWYSLFEAKPGEFFPLTEFSPVGKSGFQINQCLWDMVDSNPAGMRLMEQQMETEGDKLIKVYAEKPEFIVRFGFWPTPFKIEVGRGKSTARRDYAEKQILNPTPVAKFGAFDLLNLRLNPSIGGIVAKAKTPAEKLAQLELEIQNTATPEVLQVLWAQAKARLEEDNAEFFKNPVGKEWVEFYFDSWVISPCV